MRTYFSNIIPRIQKYSKRLDDLSLLTGQQWTLIDEETKDRTVYIFKDDGRLLISHNGKITKASWEYLGDNSVMIDKEGESYLFRQGFFDENIMALQLDNSESYVFMVNEVKMNKRLKSASDVKIYLERSYLEKYSDLDNTQRSGLSSKGKADNISNTTQQGEKSSENKGVGWLIVVSFVLIILLVMVLAEK